MTNLTNRTALKAIFETGDPLNQSAFVDLIDTLALVNEDEAEFVTSYIDDAGPTYVYYGGMVGSAWQVNRFAIATGVRTEATIGNNGSYATLALAWAAHTSLTYA